MTNPPDGITNPGPDCPGAQTIPWPPEIVEKLAEAGLDFLVGLELYDRLAARSRNLGWDPEASTWAGVPISKSASIPPRALLVLQGITAVSYLEDVDVPRPPDL